MNLLLRSGVCLKWVEILIGGLMNRTFGFGVVATISLFLITGYLLSNNELPTIEGSWVYSTDNCAGGAGVEGLYEVVFGPKLAADAVNRCAAGPTLAGQCTGV